MNRFLIKTSLLAFLLGSILIILELWVRSIPNESSYKCEYMEKNISDIKVLCLGSSVARSGINPDIFPVNAFNVAQVSQDLETDCAILHKYLSRADSLEYVLLPILPMSYSYRMGEFIDRPRLRKYSIYMDLDVEKPDFEDRFELSNFSAAVVQIITYLKGGRTIECYKKGMGDDNLVDNETAKRVDGEKISRMHNDIFFNHKDNYRIIVPALENAIKECANHNVKVIICVVPCYYTYRDNIASGMVSECDSISRVIATRYPNVTYLNYYTDSTFVTEDFRNSNHLSQCGANKLTKQIVKKIYY